MSTSARAEGVGLTASTVLWLVACLSMLQPLATDLYLPALPGIARHFNADVATVQWTLSIFVAGFGLWQLVAGPLSDRFGRAPVILCGVATYCAASVLCMLAPTIDVLIAGRLLQAIGACSCLVGARGVVRDLLSPSEGARLLAAGATIMAVAPLLGPLIGAHLFIAFGWRSAFAALTFASLMLLAFTGLRLRETNLRLDRDALAPGPMLRTYARVARSPTFRAYTLAASTSYAGLFAFLSGSSFVLIGTYGMSGTAFGLSFALMVSGYMIGTIFCRRLLARVGVRHTIAVGACVQVFAGTTMAALALAGQHVPAAIIAPMFFYGISHGIVQPPVQSGAVAPFANSAGAAAALMGFTMMLIASLVGFLIGTTHDGTVYPLALAIWAASIATFVLAFTLVRRHGDVSQYR